MRAQEKQRLLKIFQKMHPDLLIDAVNDDVNILSLLSGRIREYNEWVDYDVEFYKALQIKKLPLGELLFRDFEYLCKYSSQMAVYKKRIFFGEVTDNRLNAMGLSDKQSGQYLSLFSSAFLPLIHSITSKMDMLREPKNRDLMEKYDEFVFSKTYSDGNISFCIIKDIYYACVIGKSINPLEPEFYYAPYDLIEKIVAIRQFAIAHEVGHFSIDVDSLKESFSKLEEELGWYSPRDPFSRAGRIRANLEVLNEWDEEENGSLTYRKLMEASKRKFHFPTQFFDMVEDSADNFALDALFSKYQDRQLNEQDIYELTNVAYAPILYIFILMLIGNMTTPPNKNISPSFISNRHEPGVGQIIRYWKIIEGVTQRLSKISPSLVGKVKNYCKFLDLFEMSFFGPEFFKAFTPLMEKYEWLGELLSNNFYNTAELVKIRLDNGHYERIGKELNL